MLKTKQQEIAFYCLKCLERVKLARDGRWLDIRKLQKCEIATETLKPRYFRDFQKFRLYDGVKKEIFGEFISWFFKRDNPDIKSERDDIFNSVIEKLKASNPKGKGESDDEYKKRLNSMAKDKISEYISGEEVNYIDDDIRSKIHAMYQNKFKPDFSKYKYLSDYTTHAKRLPQMIVSNGLIPTLAFYKSRGKDRGQIYTDLCGIMEALEFKPYIEWKLDNKREGSLLLEFLVEIDFQNLRLATSEALAIAEWMKRISEAEGEEEP